MRFKCVSCGVEFDNIEQLASHKRQHQAAPINISPGVTCLGCAKRIPLDPYKLSYKGPLTCPNCHRTMTVVTEGGEVVFARLG